MNRYYNYKYIPHFIYKLKYLLECGCRLVIIEHEIEAGVPVIQSQAGSSGAWAI